jgi:hypothetical protein
LMPGYNCQKEYVQATTPPITIPPKPPKRLYHYQNYSNQ